MIVIFGLLIPSAPCSSTALWWGAVALFGLSLLLVGALRTSRRRGALRRELNRSRVETAAVSKERDDLTDQRQTARTNRERAEERLPPQGPPAAP